MEEQIRKSLESFTARLRSTAEAELDTIASELNRQLADAREAGRAEALAEAQAQAQEQARAQADAQAQADSARQLEAAATARANERDARLEAVERLLASVRRIDAAPSLRDTLEVLVQSASLEAPRVAVLLIEGNSVRVFSQRGFHDVPPTGPIAAGGIVEACVQLGQPAFTGDAAGLKAPGFASLADDRAGFSVPLRVGHRTVAVLYADDASDGEHDAPAAWPEALELLARHASQHLENLTALRVNGSGAASDTPAGSATESDPEAAKRYARLLISEIKLYNETAVRLGREQRDLGSRLGTEIARARRAYTERIPETLVDRDRYFESELVQTLAGGDASAL